MIFAEVKLSGIYAQATDIRPIPAGLIGGKIAFEFTDGCWDTLAKTVVFKGADTRDVLLENNIAIIPHEVVAQKGHRLEVGVYGANADDTIAIPALWVDLGEIRDAADPSGDPATDPTLPIWAQMQSQIYELQENGNPLDEETVEKLIQEYLQENPPMQFETDETLSLKDGILSVNTTDAMERDNTLPITSAGVYVTVGNIEALLKTI